MFRIFRKIPFKRSLAIPLFLTTTGGLTVYAQNSFIKEQPVKLDTKCAEYTGKDQQIKLKSRKQHLEEVTKTNEYDLIIVGGGCSGSGVFLEAANRGMKCLLLESNDFSSGATSKSTKLIHGGLRYLQDVFEFSLQGGRIEKYQLVQEALSERNFFVENAYYMNRQIPFVIPTTNIFFGTYYFIGCYVYHLIYLFNRDYRSKFSFNAPQLYQREQLEKVFPSLDKQYQYGVVYYDGQFNDSRMNMEVLLTGTVENYNQGFQGGNILNYAEVTKITKDSKGKVNGVVFKDKLDNQVKSVKGKIVVNCTGTFSDKIRKMDNPECQQRILCVGGSHLTLPRIYGSKKHALLVPQTQDGRVLFLVPWQRSLIVGTTEQSYDEPIINPTVQEKEVQFMVNELSHLYTKIPLDQIKTDLSSKWSGLRPLVLDNQTPGQPIDTKKVARKHVIEVSDSGLVSLMGGKWTVYRKMGEETVNQLQEMLKEKGRVIKSKKNSQMLRLLGEANKDPKFRFPERKEYIDTYVDLLVKRHNIDRKIAKQLFKNYGIRAFDILLIAEQEKDVKKQSFWKQRLHPSHNFINAEVLYHIRYELAQYPQDIMLRRMRLGFIDSKAMLESVNAVCDIFATEFNWKKDQLEKYKKEVFNEIQKLDF